MSAGVLLDGHGRPEGHARVEDLARVEQYLARAREQAGPFELRGSMQTWRETLYTTVADTQVLNTVTETIMVPDFTIPAGYLYPGRTLKYTLFFDLSTVITTPGTIIFRLRWGGVAGTVLAYSAGYVPDPTAAAVDLPGHVEFYMTCRETGTSAASLAMGRMFLNDHDDTDALLQTQLNTLAFGSQGSAAAPGPVNIDTTAAAALSPTVKFSVATATTQCTTHLAILESLS